MWPPLLHLTSHRRLCNDWQELGVQLVRYNFPVPPFDVVGKSHVFSSFIGLKAAPIGRLLISLCRLQCELLAPSILSSES